MSFSSRIFSVFALLSVMVPVLFGCGDQPLFDELATNRLKVVIKGTYESNSPRDWVVSVIEDDSIDDGDSTGLISFPDKFMLDIAELKLGGKRFALYRETYTFDVLDTDPFFNGTGVYYKNDDVPDKTYSNVNMYIRKMIFNNARKYRLEDDGIINGIGLWADAGPAETIFREDTIEGFDFNQLQVNTYYDSLLKQSSNINRIFPLSIPIDGNLVYDRDNPETVLEIRLIIKNFVKKYEYDYTSDYRYAYHFFGLSDWLRDVQADDTYMGGNLHAVARTYVPGKTVRIHVTAPSASRYVIAIQSDRNILEYTPSLTARPARPLQDAPRVPDTVVPNDLEAYLDYYLKYEKYKVDYNDFVTNITSDYENEYELPWTSYDTARRGFLLPPIATWSTTIDYYLDNVPTGKTYHIYYSNAVSIGELPVSFTQIGGDIVIDQTQAGSTINVP